jgi:hypothetical protein
VPVRIKEASSDSGSGKTLISHLYLNSTVGIQNIKDEREIAEWKETKDLFRQSNLGASRVAA